MVESAFCIIFVAMIRIKKLDRFILKTFLILFAGTFLICLFIFMMQFLWRFVDELIGKGLSMSVLGEFFFYAALTLVPQALPLAVLLASLISFGNLGEQFELLAMKAAGIPLIRIMRPLWIVVVGLCLVSFYFQNVIAPKAEVKLWTLLVSMKQKSPELDIPEGIFYSDVPGYNIYVGKKNRDTGVMYDLMIYNFEDGFENAHIVLADSGRMDMTADKKFLVLTLYSGEQFENLKAQNRNDQSVPYRRESFGKKVTIIEFDSDFKMADSGFMNTSARSKNISQLVQSIDSMEVRQDSVGRAFYNTAINGIYRKIKTNMSTNDSLKYADVPLSHYDIDSIYRSMSLVERQSVLSNASSDISKQTNDFSFKTATVGDSEHKIRSHEAAFHKKFSMALSCLFFFFIGAPLGGIIRKGGLGMPVVISVLFFLIYYIIDTAGYKMARDGYWIVWTGMWMSSAILAPIGFFLTYNSNRDSVMFNVDTYLEWLKRVIGIRGKRHLAVKEVVIDDPNYTEVIEQLGQLSADINTYLSIPHALKMPNYIYLWLRAGQDKPMEDIINKMEHILHVLSNSKSSHVIKQSNAYPIVPMHAHTRPFSNTNLNRTAGLLFPIGLVFYGRVWAFRLRLKRDLQNTLILNEQMIKLIEHYCIKEEKSN